ncbi:MAG: hypothetical protein WC632_02560 [Candidatus Margulisiibacteriota bacterium]
MGDVSVQLDVSVKLNLSNPNFRLLGRTGQALLKMGKGDLLSSYVGETKDPNKMNEEDLLKYAQGKMDQDDFDQLVGNYMAAVQSTQTDESEGSSALSGEFAPRGDLSTLTEQLLNDILAAQRRINDAVMGKPSTKAGKEEVEHKKEEKRLDEKYLQHRVEQKQNELRARLKQAIAKTGQIVGDLKAIKAGAERLGLDTSELDRKIGQVEGKAVEMGQMLATVKSLAPAGGGDSSTSDDAGSQLNSQAQNLDSISARLDKVEGAVKHDLAGIMTMNFRGGTRNASKSSISVSC